ncbi:MAG TPA: fructosamine kinase family protein [Chryseosolibacter sp.]|nr:fructosamine kinase family protein [Chryseosolibacter sp.]
MYSDNKIPDVIIQSLDEFIGRRFMVTPSGGGCINNTCVIEAMKGRFFLKWNDALKYPGMLAAEVLGLQQVRSANAIRTPRVLAQAETNTYQYLLLECIASAPRSHNFWNDFGRQLALLHSCSSTTFGLDHDNYIGSLPQTNSTHDRWVDFLIHKRLKPQLDLALSNSLIANRTIGMFEKLFLMLPGVLSERQPCLLHGDLWSGNLMTDENGSPCLIDPAIYFGDNEVDLAMTQLFGGFDLSFLSAYQEITPLEEGWRERFDIYNLYPLLVHVNIFGETYVSQLHSMLRRFV